MGAERTAVIGVGQTRHVSARHDVSIAGLVRGAAQEALDDAGLDWGDIDAVVIGKAPDMFEGVVMPELYLADALGAAGKPMILGTPPAASAARLRSSRPSSCGGCARACALTVVFEKQSESNARNAGSVGRDAVPGAARRGAGGYFAPIIRGYIRRSGAPEHIGHLVSVKDRLNALRNPKAQLHLPDIDLKTVQESMLLWAPLRLLDVCPSSDGAMAMVIGSEQAAARAPGPVAWIHGTAMRSEPTMFAGRDQVNPLAGKECAADVYRQAGITNPRGLRLRRGLRAVLVVRAHVAREPRVLRRGRRLEAHRVGRDRI